MRSGSRTSLVAAMLAAVACAGEARRVGDGVAVRQRGVGAPIVLVGAGPGVCGDADLDAFAALAAEATLVAFDYRGCGASPSARTYSLGADLADLATVVAAQPSPPWVIGHSYGAMLALRLAIDRPEAARGLVLIAPAVDGASLRRHADARAARLGDDAARRHALGARLTARRANADEVAAWWDLEGRAQVADASAWPAIGARTRVAPEPLLAIQSDLLAFDVRTRLSSVRGPVAIIAGDADPVVGAAPREVHDAIAGSAYFVASAGHWPHQEDPRVVPWIHAFLRAPR